MSDSYRSPYTRRKRCILGALLTERFLTSERPFLSGADVYAHTDVCFRRAANRELNYTANSTRTYLESRDLVKLVSLVSSRHKSRTGGVQARPAGWYGGIRRLAIDWIEREAPI